MISSMPQKHPPARIAVSVFAESVFAESVMVGVGWVVGRVERSSTVRFEPRASAKRPKASIKAAVVIPAIVVVFMFLRFSAPRGSAVHVTAAVGRREGNLQEDAMGAMGRSPKIPRSTSR